MSDDRVRRIYQEAMELPASAREAYVREACGDDQELIFAVLERIVEGEETHDTGDATVAQIPPQSRVPDRIGPYHIVDTLGAGGFGVVYLAEQHEPVHRRVALKIIKPGMDSDHIVARFAVERQALAIMDHANVAKVFDFGTTEPEFGSRPYFVMEYVRGTPITDHCDRERLGINDRLQLFIDVCEAVHHAHQKGVIHRDLKPSNILVSIDGKKHIPKVIDFGVAKALDRPLSEKHALTRLGQLVGTPEYMSPEQAEMSAQDIDTRSDVYSLGVLLYELLTGVLPFDPSTLRSAAYNEIQRIIREVTPPRPSTRLSTLGASTRMSSSEVAQRRRVDVRTLERNLRGDLDWVILRAIEKDRTRRYGSAEAFADDVRRFIRNEPVQASPPSIAYRTKKFVRRNRLLVGSAAAILAAITIGGIVSTYQAVRATRAEEVTRTQRDALVTFSGELLTDIANEIEPLEGSTPARRVLLTATLQFIEQLQRFDAQDAEVQAVATKAYANLAELLGGTRSGSTGDLPGALDAIRTARAQLDEMLASAPDDPELLKASWTVEIILGDLAYRSSETDGAEAELHYAAARDIAQALMSLQNRAPEHRRRLAVSQLKLGDSARRRGDNGAALKHFEECLSVRRALREEDPDSQRARRDLAIALGRVGDQLSRMGSNDDAFKMLEESIELRRAEMEENPGVARYKRDLMNARFMLGFHRMQADQLDAAGQDLRFARDLAVELLESDPTNARAQEDLVRIYRSYADLLMARDEPTEALRTFELQRDRAAAILTRDPTNAVIARFVAYANARIGEILLSTDRLPDARRRFADADEQFATLVADDPTNVSLRLEWIAQIESYSALRRAEGDENGADDELRRAVRIIDESPDQSDQLRERRSLIANGVGQGGEPG